MIIVGEMIRTKGENQNLGFWMKEGYVAYSNFCKTRGAPMHLILALFLSVSRVCTNFFIVFLESGQIFTCFGKFTLLRMERSWH